MKVEAILTPAEIAGLARRDLSAATCVVFDVLRATSTMLTALAAGAKRIFPVLSAEEARALQRTRLPDALLGGERGGIRIESFDLGNSPREYAAEVVSGRDIISTTTNGTVALRACAGAKEILAGAWLNLDALAVWLQSREQAMTHLMLVCAGTGETFALEDGYAAGGLIAKLMPSDDDGDGALAPSVDWDDAALGLLDIYRRSPDAALSTLRKSANGRRLVENGLGKDVESCAATSSLPWVAIMRAGALEGEFVTCAR